MRLKTDYKYYGYPRGENRNLRHLVIVEATDTPETPVDINLENDFCLYKLDVQVAQAVNLNLSDAQKYPINLIVAVATAATQPIVVNAQYTEGTYPVDLTLAAGKTYDIVLAPNPTTGDLIPFVKSEVTYAETAITIEEAALQEGFDFGEDLETEVDGSTITFKSGKIYYYTEDPARRRPAGNRAMLKIAPPAAQKAEINLAATILDLNGTIYTLDKVNDGTAEDPFVYWYPLVEHVGITIPAHVEWVTKAGVTIPQDYNIVIDAACTLAPASEAMDNPPATE